MLFFQKTKGTKGVQGGFDLDFDNSDGEMDEDHANNKLLVEFVVVCGVEEEPPRECAPFVSRHRVFQVKFSLSLSLSLEGGLSKQCFSCSLLSLKFISLFIYIQLN